MHTERMHLIRQSKKDVYKTIVKFRNADSSLFVLTFRGQEPLPAKFSDSDEYILPIVDGVKCYFRVGSRYNLTFTKICYDKIIEFTYYEYFANFDKDDCSLIKDAIKHPNVKKIKFIQAIHPYVEIHNQLFQMDVFNCTTKFQSN